MARFIERSCYEVQTWLGVPEWAYLADPGACYCLSGTGASAAASFVSLILLLLNHMPDLQQRREGFRPDP